MRTLEYGKEHEKTLLFLPCTAEPEWAFADSVGLLSQDYHVMQIVYDGHGETGEDFISVETTVDEVTDWLQARGITHLNAAYGCSLGGACLTRFLALGKIPVERAVIDAGITPYRMPLILRRLACLRDDLGFRLIAKSRKVLETVYPPERWTMPGRDPVKEYDALAAYLKTYSKRTVRNIFWSANNYTLPTKPAERGCQITYWYGEEEKQARHSNICFIKQYFPRVQLHEIPKMDHAELVMMYPQEFYRRIMEFLTHTGSSKRKKLKERKNQNALSAAVWIQRRYRLMKIIVAIAFYFLYWGVCFLGTGTDKKNLMGLRSYPEEVQNRVRSDPQLGKAVPKGKSTAAVWLSNLLLFTVVFSALGLALRGVLNLDGYLSAFWYFLTFGEGLGLFDLLVIDLLWWRNTKRTRFSFLPEKKYYQNPKKHIESFWRGIPLFAAVAALSALIVTAF